VQLSYNNRYPNQQQQSAFYDSPSSFDYAVAGSLNGNDHPSSQRSRPFCAVQSQQPQPAHCGGRATAGLHSSGGPTSWLADQRPDSFRSTHAAPSDMTSSVRGKQVCGA
jgi:hypothetical protein